MSMATTKRADDAYHRDYENVSQSMLKVLDESPLLYYHRFVAQDLDDKDSEDKKLGRCLHVRLLERDRFDELCPRMPPFHLDAENKTDKGKPSTSKSTGYYQAKKEEFERATAGKDVIDNDMLAKLVAMESAVLKNDDARALIAEHGDNEVTHYWEDRISRRCKMDIPRPSLKVIADIKAITGRPTPQAFAKNCAQWRWWIQADWYRDAAYDLYGDDFRFLFILVGKEAPHEVGIYEIDPDDMEWAETRVDQLVTELLLRHERNDWTAEWQKAINVVPLPKYVKSNFYDVEE